jgi:acetoacetate decarboxylase
MTEYIVQNANNMPLQAPLFPDPLVPYECPNNRSLNAICRMERRRLEKYLQGTPFELASDLFLVYVSDFTNCAKMPFMDAGIVIPVRYGAQEGGFFLFEYEDNDSAIAAGRDLWGYPKKYGEISLVETDGKVRAEVRRKGVSLISIECETSRSIDVPPVQTTPHLNIHVQPAPDGAILSKRLIARDTSADFQTIRTVTGPARVELQGLPSDPLHELQPTEVLGASFVTGNFFATEKNGWGRTIANLA